MVLKRKKTSLANKISSLVTSVPTNFDSDDEVDDTKAKLVERCEETDYSDEDDQNSNFRKQNVDLLDQIDNRYKGKKVSRKDVYDEDITTDSNRNSESEGSEDDQSDTENLSENDNDTSENDDDQLDSSQSADSEGNESSSNEELNSDVEDENSLRKKSKSDFNFQNMSGTNVRVEVEKGNCVREQLKVWESILEIRIKLQKCLITSNRMPQYDIYKNLKSDNTFTNNVNDARGNLTRLLDNMLKLQDVLLKNYPETKNLLSEGKKRKLDDDENENPNEDHMDEEIPSDTEDEMEEEKTIESEEEKAEEEEEEIPKKKLKLVDYERILSKRHMSYSSYRNSVIQKWNDKTRVAAGKFSKGSNQPVVKQIDFVLGDKSKLLKRTQLKRSEYEIVGKIVTTEENEDGRRVQEHDPEIYDDDDFYHQLLRELIEYKSSDLTDPIQLSKQWIQLQNMRSKMKRKIDTKATKGRRVRYNVHTRLVNFMAPITVNDTWTDLAKNELYNSLFGKIKAVESKVSKGENSASQPEHTASNLNG